MTLDLTKPIMLPHDKKPWRVVYCDDLSVLVEGGALNARAHHARQYIDEYAENIPPYTPPKPGPTNTECANILHYSALACMNHLDPKDDVPLEEQFAMVRRWFADVTARIEWERGQ